MSDKKVFYTIRDLSDDISKQTNIPSFVVEKVLRVAAVLIQEKKEFYVDDVYVEIFSDLFQK